jgi:tetratricopeptide (TPR) repeat protein
LEPIKISERLKYYRNILGIGQKALVDEFISINLIKHVEGGKRRLTIHKAMILSDRLNAIAKEKGIELNVTARDLLMTDEETAQKICLDELNIIDEKIYDEEKYNKILDIAQSYHLKDVFIEVYEKIARYYYSIRDFKNSIKYYEQALELAIKIGNDHKKAKILNSTGVNYYLMEDYIKALEIYDECYNLLINTNIRDAKLESKLLYNLALCNRKLRRHSEALKFLDLLLTLKDFDEAIVINGMILKANIYLEDQEYEHALQLYKAISVYGPRYMYIIQNNMAHAFLKLDKVDESIEYLTKSIKAQLEEPSPTLTISLRNMGFTYNDEKLYDLAIIFYEHTINNAINYQQVDLIAECYENLYILYNKIDKTNIFNNITNKLIEFKNSTILSENQMILINQIIDRYSESKDI